MKQLRNNKTGKIGYLYANKNENYNVLDENDKVLACYETLKDVAEKWEDYKEDYYFIDSISCSAEWACGRSKEITNARKEVGNYFETIEECRKAIEKLKAWKRLRDKGFKFEGLTLSGWGCSCVEYKVDGGISDSNSDMQVREDLDLIFGGEE